MESKKTTIHGGEENAPSSARRMNRDHYLQLASAAFQPRASESAPQPFLMRSDLNRSSSGAETDLAATLNPASNADYLLKLASSNSTSENKALQGTTLPTILHYVLSNESLAPTVSWLSEGKLWIIHNIKEFEKLVLPLFFEYVFPQTIDGFHKALSGWGIQLAAAGPNSATFFHEVRTYTRSLYLDVVCDLSSHPCDDCLVVPTRFRTAFIANE
jgi:hypothetical protein